jgi:hypothetical protein
MRTLLLRTLLSTLAVAAALPFLAHAAEQRDGAIVRNSGSTNTAPFAITVWSDASGEVRVQDGAPRAFAPPPDTVARFFSDLKAAHANPGTPQHCMKSASFGTSTTVAWHGWISPDLQCPPSSPAISALAQDVDALKQAAGILPTLRRIRLPGDMRMIPTATPEVEPT